MKPFKVSEKIFLSHTVNTTWNIVSSKNALELFHPFCLKNDVLEHTKKDELLYLNGMTYVREFYSWKPNEGFELYIGREKGKKSRVVWELKTAEKGCEIKISVLPYRSSKIAKLWYPLFIFYCETQAKKILAICLKRLRILPRS